MKLNWEISSKELQLCIPHVVLVDVREPEEHELVSIPGSLLIPLGELSTRAPLELNPQDSIVLYCAHGVRSLYAVRILQTLGFEKLKSLQGGIEEWLNHDGSFQTSH